MRAFSKVLKLAAISSTALIGIMGAEGFAQNQITGFPTLDPNVGPNQTTWNSGTGTLVVYGNSPGSADSNSFNLLAATSYKLIYTFSSVGGSNGLIKLWNIGFTTNISLQSSLATTTGITFTAAQLSTLAGQTVVLSFGNTSIGSFQTFTNISFAPLSNAVDAANTLVALTANGYQVRNALTQRASAITNTMDYDCRDFSTKNICISFQARYTGFDSMSDGAGVLTATYRIDPNLRIGAFIDQRAVQGKKTGIDYSGDIPTVGAFLGYTQQPNGTGLQAKLAVSGNTGKITATRDASLTSTEAGSGKSSLNSWAVGGELGWGMMVGNSTLATPYIGLRYTDVTRGSYTEATTTDVTSPLSYASNYQRQTTATTGMRFAGQLTDVIGYQVGIGGEYDVGRSANHYSGTSSITGLETFSVNTNTTINRIRANASAGLSYAIDKSQKLITSVSVRQQAYSSQPSVTATAGYQISF